MRWWTRLMGLKGIKQGLDPSDAAADPYDQFAHWYRFAERARVCMPESMFLATVGASGQPSGRIVLLKGFGTDSGFQFYTNFQSRKATELDAEPRASLVFHWVELHRQIRIEGHTEKLPAEEADRYFASRPRQSQIGAWASHQSRPLESRSALKDRVRTLTEQFRHKSVERPSFWGGYRLWPQRIEFWQGRPYRLHDRVLYYRDEEDQWTRIRLYP